MKPNWFIAWPVAPGPWLGELLAGAPRFLRRFHPTDLHVTLAFLGPVVEDQAWDAWDLALHLPLAPIHATLDRVEGFGNPRAPSAFSLTVTGEDLSCAIGDLRGALYAAAGAPPDSRPPRPHCTVARPGRQAGGPERAAGLAWARSVPPLNTRVILDRLALYTWSEDRRERQFRIMAERRLA